MGQDFLNIQYTVCTSVVCVCPFFTSHYIMDMTSWTNSRLITELINLNPEQKRNIIKKLIHILCIFVLRQICIEQCG